MTYMHFNFTIKTLTYTGPLVGPECYNFFTKINFDNSDFDGQIPIDLIIEPHRRECPKPTLVGTKEAIYYRVLNYFVIAVCAVSLILCLRALYRAQMLRIRAEKFFKKRFNWDLDSSERLNFLNGWWGKTIEFLSRITYWKRFIAFRYIVICINDVLIIIGSIIKELIESRNVYGDLWDYCSLCLGIGVLLVWAGMLRYLSFFKTYNALILTVKKALPSALRFLLCAGIVYFGEKNHSLIFFNI